MMNDRIEHTEHRRPAAQADHPVAWAGPDATGPIPITPITPTAAPPDRRA